MPPKRARKDIEDDAPEVTQPSKKAKVSSTKSATKTLPVRKTSAAKEVAATKKVPAKPASKAASKTATKKTTATKAPPKKEVTKPATSPTTNGKAVKPVIKAEKKQPVKETKVVKKADPLDLAYAEPSPALKKLPAKKAINEIIYTKPLDIFVCGEGSNAELGLGTSKKQIDVKRPRFNAAISGKNIVRIAAGGMHVLALSADGEIFSWGVNDQGALGRDTRWDGGLKDMDAGDDSDSEEEDEDSGMNPHEANPAPINSSFFHPGTQIVDIVAGDSCSFALTTEGRVYGWGTFRSNEGILGFSKEIDVQHTPLLIKTMKNVTKLAAGADHVLALDDKGTLWAWGSGQQNQLGRRIIERTKREGLNPGPAVIRRTENGRNIKVADIACGAYNSFAIDKDGRVWSWGANNYGECGQFDNAGEDRAIILYPTMVEDLEKDGKPIQIKHIDGGAHHTVAITTQGKPLVWGRCDGGQTGIPLEDLNKEHVITNTALRASEVEEKQGSVATKDYKILAYPTHISDIGNTATFAACGTDHTIIITSKGKAWTAGFSANYQTGQGTDEDVDDITVIDNTATRDRKLVWAGAGGQFSIFAAEKGVQVNGF